MSKYKYIDAEKLKAEIQRRFKGLREEYERTASFRCDGGMDELDKLEQFIDSLQQEQPEADLDAEIEKMIYDPLYDIGGVAIKGATAYITVEDVADLARHFAEWGAIHLNARKEEYERLSHTLAIGFIRILDENRPDGKMNLSNSECTDIELAFKNQDWTKLARYVKKYTNQEDKPRTSEEESDDCGMACGCCGC